MPYLKIKGLKKWHTSILTIEPHYRIIRISAYSEPGLRSGREE
jgi:hypothetical protein